MAAPVKALAPDLTAGLKRLKLRAFRELAPEIMQTAKTQRWAPEEILPSTRPYSCSPTIPVRPLR